MSMEKKIIAKAVLERAEGLESGEHRLNLCRLAAKTGS